MINNLKPYDFSNLQKIIWLFNYLLFLILLGDFPNFVLNALRKFDREEYPQAKHISVTLRLDDSRSFFYGCIMFSNKGAELDFHSILLQRSTNTDFSRAEKEFILNWRSYCDSLHNQVQAIKNYASTLYSLERGGHA